MAVKVMHWVWEYAADVQGSDLLVLLALADWANDEGLCWPSIPRLAAKARVSVRTAQYTIRRLIARGYLTVEPGGGRRCPNRYTVQPPRPMLPSPRDGEGLGVRSATETMQPLHPSGPKTPQPLHPSRGATDDTKGANHDEKGAIRDRKGATAVAPEPLEEPSREPSREPSGENARVIHRSRFGNQDSGNRPRPSHTQPAQCGTAPPPPRGHPQHSSPTPAEQVWQMIIRALAHWTPGSEPPPLPPDAQAVVIALGGFPAIAARRPSWPTVLGAFNSLHHSGNLTSGPEP